MNRDLISILAIGLILGACGGGNMIKRMTYGETSPKVPVGMPEPIQFTANLVDESYESCAALANDLKLRRERHLAYHAAMSRYWDSLASDSDCFDHCTAESESEHSAPTPSTIEEESITNVQEKGIDESDFVKRVGGQILVLHGLRLEVLDQASRTRIGTLDLSDTFIAESFTNSITSIKMLVAPGRLILLGQQSNRNSLLKVFAIKNGALPEALWQQELVGFVSESRLRNGSFYAISSHQDNQLTAYVNDYQHNSKFHFYNDNTSLDSGIPCNSIRKSPWDDLNTNIQSIYSINILGDQPLVRQKHYLGNHNNHIYWGPNHIVLSSTQYDFRRYFDVPEPGLLDGGSLSIVTRISYDADTGTIGEGQRVGIPGEPTQGQWAFKDLPDSVTAMVTTTNIPLKEVTATANHTVGRNHLWLLGQAEESLSILGSQINFGKVHEDVRSVRFIENHAYVVTFEKTDPLYSFDISDPRLPVMKDALEIPGFSMYMHPFGEGRLIGLGYDAVDMGNYSLYQGIQLSLFDNENAAQLSQLDRQVFGVRGSFSDVTSDHKAFFADEDLRLFGFPLVSFEHATENPSPSAFGPVKSFSGALIMGLENDQMVEQGRVSHIDLIPAECQDLLGDFRWWADENRSQDVNRLFKDEDSLVSVSRFGIKFHDPLNGFATTHVISFDHLCEPSQPVEWIGD